jgi:hypothetical protein
MFVGQASAIGLTIEIPSLIKSLAGMLMSPNTNFLSFKQNSDLWTDLFVRVENPLHSTCLVKTYSYNWWVKNKVRPAIT